MSSLNQEGSPQEHDVLMTAFENLQIEETEEEVLKHLGNIIFILKFCILQ